MRRVFLPSITIHNVDPLSTIVQYTCCNETNWPVLFHKTGANWTIKSDNLGVVLVANNTCHCIHAPCGHTLHSWLTVCFLHWRILL